MPTEARASHFVRSFERGLAVIRSFDAERPERTLSEVARACGLPRAAVRRLLLTLVDLGYVHSDGRLFRLTPRVLELGYAYLAGLTLPQIARPHLEQLVADVRESSSLCLLDGDDIVYVARVPTRRIMAESITVGTRFPALVTSVGRAILAHAPDEDLDARLARACPPPLTARTIVDPDALRAELRRVRRQGHALVDQELEEGLRSVAVPVRGRDGAVVAGVNIAVSAGRTTVAAVRRDLLPPLLATVARIEADLRITDPAPLAAGEPGGSRGPHRSGPPPTPAG
ncbi:helix-turn-helix domain-containing protein [Streptomyces adustus]|uniref:Glycerol operon regulatory protein n=1 Tax=Streptomyces adustus TaxID=1609272 RepID=A0A5N8VDE9_9ACTN|nr:IclR family transcriptional regulator C-terminal domain-containing protein [Streptomyces adustus]MPY33290.1 helix-turn-helix domain-containing protein [Streptomyces adustus]